MSDRVIIGSPFCPSILHICSIHLFLKTKNSLLNNAKAVFCGPALRVANAGKGFCRQRRAIVLLAGGFRRHLGEAPQGYLAARRDLRFRRLGERWLSQVHLLVMGIPPLDDVAMLAEFFSTDSKKHLCSFSGRSGAISFTFLSWNRE